MIIRTRDEVGVAMAETNRSYAAGLPHSCKGSLVLCWLSDPFPWEKHGGRQIYSSFHIGRSPYSKLKTLHTLYMYYVLRIEYYVYTTISARQFQACKDFTMHLWWSLTSNLCKHLPKLWWDQTWKHTMLSSHRGWSCVFINICVYGNMYICGSDSLHLKKSARKYLLPRTNSYQSKSKEFNTKTKHTSRHQLSAYFHFNMEGIWNIVRIEELLTKKWKFQFLISSPAVTWICIPSHT